MRILLMSKPGYVRLLFALAYTTTTPLMPAAYAEDQQPATPSAPATPPTPPPASSVPASADETAGQKLRERYQDGIVIWETPDDVKVPFSLKFNLNTQVRYLNTTDSEPTFT